MPQLVYRQNQEKAPGTRLSAEQAVAIFKPEAGTIHVYAPDQSPQVHDMLVTTTQRRRGAPITSGALSALRGGAGPQLY